MPIFEQVSIIKAETVTQVVADDVNVEIGIIMVAPLHLVVHHQTTRITAEEAAVVLVVVTAMAVMVALEDVTPSTTTVVAVEDRVPQAVPPLPALARVIPALTPSLHTRREV